MTEFSERKYFVAVAGNIGVGKTTLSQELARQLKWHCYLEPVIDNPYLEDFYANMDRWSFHLQVYFLSKRFESQREIEVKGYSCVQDRTIYEDVEIFARTLHNRGHLIGRDWDNYRSLFAAMTSYLKKPDLIIYLRCDVETLIRRIQSRGRSWETKIDPDYLSELNKAYESWIKRCTNDFRVATIDTGHGSELNAEEVLTQCLELLRIRLQLEMPLGHV
ncbi:deoxynucleoside kinase [bacterium]|nr:deoxynucleoside kinase [bacterium]MBU1636336.1 deoxynucleoside kinase [bacterium]MBU1919548.1 deoxynucleoside kinase [bacterium]RQV98275.1 MAG: deoxynucleoside kinase [bacterium]